MALAWRPPDQVLFCPPASVVLGRLEFNSSAGLPPACYDFKCCHLTLFVSLFPSAFKSPIGGVVNQINVVETIMIICLFILLQ